MTTRHAPPTPLKRELFERGITIRALANGLGRNYAHVGRVVNGLPPGRELRAEIAAFLEADEAKIFPTNGAS